MKLNLRFLLVGAALALLPFLANAQVTLPWSEGFENVGSTTTFTSSTSSINGLSGVEYSTGSSGSRTGRLRFKAGSGFYKTGSAAATMDVNTSGSYIQNYLILTVDLRNYTSSDMELSFDFTHHGEESHSGDRVWIRGSNTSSWILAYDWYGNRPNSGQWKSVTGIDIDALLSANSQSVSSTFQIRFGQYDNFPATSTTASDGLTVDNISIVEIVPNNGTITGVQPFCAGTADVNVVLENPGANAITSGQISWSVNGTAQTPKRFTTSIASKGSGIINLGQYNFTGSSNYSFVFNIDSINGVRDSARANDTLRTTGNPALSGTYSVGGSSADYSTIGAAITAITNSGVCGPVELRLNDGTYSEQLTIGAITGASSTNNIRIVGNGADKAKITYSSSGSSNYQTVILDGANFITFDSLTIEAGSRSSGYGATVWFTNGADSNNISNCNLMSDPSSTSTTRMNVVFSNSKTSIYTSGSSGNGNTFTNNLIRGGYAGIWQYASTSSSSSSWGSGMHVEDCNIYRCYYGMYFRGSTEKDIISNNVDSITYMTLYTYYSNRDSIVQNRFTVNSSSFYNVYNYYTNFSGSSTSDTSFFINNMIANGTYAYRGWYNYRMQFHNNSISSNGTYTSYFYYPRYSTFKNNTLNNSGTGYAFYINNTANIANTDIDYNNYYGPNARYLIYYGANYTDLSSWQSSVTVQNLSSISVDPQHNSSTDLNTQSVNLNNMGTTLANVPEDIDGNPRPSSPDRFYDIGANDYYLPPYDLDVISLTPTVVSRGNNAVSITVRNTGINNITNDTAYVSFTRGSSVVRDSIFITRLTIGSDTTFTFASPLAVSADTSFTLCANIDGGIVGDPDSEDKLCENICVGSSGVYTIDINGNGDYDSFNEALNSLKGCGIAGPVTFRVMAGTYTERLDISELSGASSTNTVRFVGKGNVILQNTATGTANWATVLLNGADYVSFDSLNVKANGSSYAVCFWLANGANYNQVSNSSLEVSGTSTNVTPIVFSSSTTSIYGNGINGEYNKFENNNITGGGAGVWMRGSNSSSYIYGNEFNYNNFTGQNSYVFYCYYGSAKIHGNSMTNLGGSCYAMYGYYGGSWEITGNTIISDRYGLFMYYMDYYTSTVSTIANNMISISGNTTSSSRPLYFGYCDDWNFSHNSIYSNHSSTSTSYPLLYMSSCDYWDVKNNVFARPNNGYLVYHANSTTNTGEWYNNNYYSTWSGNEFYFAYAYYNSISALESGRGTWVKNSLDVDPEFTSSTDLHTRSLALNNAGDTTARITVDIDGEMRPMSPDTIPDIGADEYYIPPYDADVEGLATTIFTPGNNTVSALIRNNGTKTWASTDTIFLEYTIGTSNAVKDTLLPGTITPGSSTSFDFTVPYSHTGGSPYVEVCINFTKQFKGVDPDSLSEEVCEDVCANGVSSLVIDANGNGDFDNFTEAAEYLACAGVSNALTIRVKDGTYTERVTLGAISGASASNTIRFVGESTDAKLTSTYSSYPDFRTLTLDGAKHVTLDSLTIEAGGSTYGWAITLMNAADSNTIKNCVINSPITSNSNYSTCIVATSSTTSFTISGNNANSLLVENNILTGGTNTIHLQGSSSGRNENNRIIGNTFKNSGSTAIQTYYQEGLNFSGNEIINANASSSGIISWYNENSSINGNKIQAGFAGMQLIYENSLSTSDTSAIVNNMISNFSTTGSNEIGIYAAVCQDISVIHNSVSIKQTTSNSLYASFSNNASTGIIVENNVFASSSGGYAFYWNSSASGTIDYNNYYAPNSTNMIDWGGTAYSSVSAWASAQTSYNQNSIEVNPGFISTSDLHSFSDNINNKGNNAYSWPTDYDGDARPFSPDVTVDMGADDFWIPLYDVDVLSVDSPEIAVLGNNVIKTTLQNRGLRNLIGERAVIYYTIDGGSPVRDTVSFGNLPVGNDTMVAFSTPWNITTSADFDICVTADTILGRTSDQPDQVCIQRCTGVRDTIIVDPNGNGDYTTISGAINKLNCGIYGPTVVYIKNGSYYESLSIGTPLGASITNTIEFIGESRNGVVIDNGSSSYATLELDGASNMSFENMSIQNSNTVSAAGNAVLLTGASHNIDFNNITFEVDRNSTINGVTAILTTAASGGTYSGNTSAYDVSFRNSDVIGGYYGTWLIGNSSSDADSNQTFDSCNFKHQYQYAVYTYYQEDFQLNNSTIDSIGNDYGYGVYNYYSHGGQFANNQITTKGYGIYNFACNYVVSTDSTMFINNVIYQNNNNFNATYGVYNYYSYNWKYHHNNFISTTQSTSTSGAALYISGLAYGVELFNNNIVAQNGGYLMYNSATTMTAGDIDNNNWYSSSFRVYHGAYYYTLGSWQAGKSSDNQNSVSVDPYFVGSEDFHASSRYLMNAGTSLGVMTDFDGENRNMNMPDIGADEIMKDMKVSMVSYPMNDCRLMGDVDSVKFTFENTGVSSFVEGDTIYVSYMEGTTMNTDTLTVPSGMVFKNGMTSDYTFDSLLNVGNPGAHSMDVWTSYFRDADRTNDTMGHGYFTNPNPVANYTVAEECEYETSEFKDASSVAIGNVTGWNWMFGDGNSSMAQNPSNDYGTYDTFYVRLIATTDSGCVDTTYGEAITHPTPVANFSTSNECHHTEADFTNSSTVAYGTLTYAWDMGDNANTSSMTDPSLTYSNDGSYTVELVATSDKGCNDTANGAITIYPTPNPDFSATEECLTDATAFTNNTSITSGTYTNSWEFGDNNTSTTASPTHTYSSANTYTVELKTTSTANGCIDSVSKSVTVNPLATSTFTATNMCFGDTIPLTNSSSGPGLTYMWYFGDGNTSTDQLPDHVYANSGTYTISLVVTTNKGCTDSSSYTVAVASQPLADFTASDDCVHNAITFTNATSVACGAVSQYIWDYGDGNSETLTTNSNPTHKYASAGTYNVELVIVLANSTRDTATRSITIHGQPAASFTNTASCEGNLMQFTSTSTAQSSTTLKGFSWTFGDGGTSTLKNPTNTYSNSGSYNVRMIVTDSRNCSDTTLKALTVSPNPSANFTYTSACAYDTVKFKNSSTVSSGSITGFTWDFGNNTTANTRHTGNVYGTSGYYQVKMVAESDAGCKDSVTKTVQAFTVPSARFTANNVCDNESMSFNNVSSNANSYAWDFGDMMGTSTMSAPSYTYGSNGNYDVELVASTTNGCMDTFTTQVTVYSLPTAAFSASNVCDGEEVSFSNSSSGANSYSWSYGDGKGSSLASPKHEYATASTYTVQLIATSSNNCKDTVSNTVTVNANPVVSISADDECTYDAVSFSNNTTGATSYAWNFDDGNSSTSMSPSHKYSSAGTYNVVLTATSSASCSTKDSISVETYPVPSASFTVADACYGDASSFKNNSTISTGTMNHAWDFGDFNGTSNNTSPSYTYGGANTYTVQLISTSNNGCKDTATGSAVVNALPKPDFSASNVCLGNAMSFSNNSSGASSYSWDFDDGNSSTSTSPSNTYSTAGKYSVMLTATSSAGCSDDLTKVVEVYSLPIASFTATNECLGDDMSTTNLSSGASSYAWTFGDGNSSTASAPTHTYGASGTYTVTLTATSSNSCTDQSSTSVSIFSLPVASFSANTVCEGTATNFTNSTSGTNSYNWNFGDGTSSTLSGPSKTYGAYGTYNVTLTATSSEGCIDDSTVTVTVNEQPTAAFASTTECSGDSTAFTNNSSGTIATYAWDFDNGSTSTDMSPKVAFTMGGSYDVELTVSTSQGCTDVVTNAVTVYSTPTAAYIVTNACLEDEAVFADNGSNGNGALIADREFHFGDGLSRFGRSVSHTYGSADTFTTAMVVTTVNGCTDTATSDVVIYPMPMVMFSGNDTCEFDAINFTNNSTIASGTLVSYDWNFGDGNSSTDETPSHSFDTLGTYTVEMTATSDNGCSSSESISIKINPKPQALFVTTEVCDNDSTRFQNHSGIAKGQLSYEWTFGDGNTSTDEHPWHMYDTFGVYDVTMRVISNKACATEYTISYEVHAQPIAALPLIPTCLGDSTLVPQQIRDLINPEWTYRLRTDDTLLTAIPEGYLYPAVGVYPTSLYIETPFGCNDSTHTDVVILEVPTLNEWTYVRLENGEMEFNATGESDTLDVSWDFGDGNGANGAVVNYTYSAAGTYEVTCTLTNGSGCTDVITKTVEVFPTGINEFTESMNFTAYPNPYTSWVKLNYDLNSAAYVRIEIIDMQGRLITTLVDDTQAEGKYIYELNENDLPIAAGNAMVKVIVDDEVLLINLVKLK